MTYADKHLKNIFLLKVACVTCCVITICIIYFSYFYETLKNKKNNLINIEEYGITKINPLEDASIQIEKIDLLSKNSTNDFYRLTAREANKNMNGIVQMKDIELAYSKIDKNTKKLFVTSESGTMKEDDKIVQIDHTAIINFNDYILKTKGLYIDLKNSFARSNSAIILMKGESELKADSFSTDKDSQIINLNGNVKATISLTDIN